MKQRFILLCFIGLIQNSFAQTDSARTPFVQNPAADIPPLRFNLNEDGSHFFQVTFLNQAWLRFNESNPGTLVQDEEKKQTVDIGLRRTRIQMFGQLTDRVFVYFQFGQNNFNGQYNQGANRKNAVFFHDAVCEYNVLKQNWLKIGAGLTIANGLSRFSQPSIGTIMTMDVPVFAQATVDATDEFSRKLSYYARGQLGKVDYRLVFTDPFPITTSGGAYTTGQTAPAISSNASFSPKGHSHQYQGYLQYQFLDKESNQTPYMTGTYLGKKSVFNLGCGIIYQPKAMWIKRNAVDSIGYQNMLLWSAEAYYDAPIAGGKGTALSAYLGYFNYNFGTNYLRYNGIMNPATSAIATGKIGGAGPLYGNSFPMFGTGQALYGQVGYLMKDGLLGNRGTLMPYGSWMHARWNRLDGKPMDVFNLGVNWLINGHKAKISLDWQNRPVYSQPSSTEVKTDGRRNQLVLQYQIFL